MRPSQKIALCIGINDYPGTSSDLSGCVNDAQDWASTLRARGFTCKLLLDSEATGDKIRQELKSLAVQAHPGDLVVVSYSGHGSFVPDIDGDEADGKDECWCPHDVSTHGVITDDELYQIQAQRKQDVRWIVLSDSCFSGTVARFSPIDTPPTTTDTQPPRRLVRFLPPNAFVQHPRDACMCTKSDERRTASHSEHDGVLLISGCQDTEYSFDAWFNGRSNGAFTFIARRALENLHHSATYEDWHKLIRQSLPSQQYSQSPNLFGNQTMKKWGVLTTLDEEKEGGEQTNSDCSKHTRSHTQSAYQQGESQALQTLHMRDQRTREYTQARGTVSKPKIPLIAEGDSWFDYPWHDILGCLEDLHGYEIDSVAHKGDLIEDMAYSGGQLDKFLRTLDRMLSRNIVPRAILLSGGGNDIAGSEFTQLLNHSDSPSRGLNQQVLAGVIDERFRDSFITIISAVTKICEARLSRKLPILIHGYNYPIPDGRGILGGWGFLPGPWLSPGLNRKGYRETEERFAIVKEMIDRFNEMQINLLKDPALNHVTHVDLRNAFPQGDNYKKWWANELHPTKRGFHVIAKMFADALPSH